MTTEVQTWTFHKAANPRSPNTCRCGHHANSHGGSGYTGEYCDGIQPGGYDCECSEFRP